MVASLRQCKFGLARLSMLNSDSSGPPGQRVQLCKAPALPHRRFGRCAHQPCHARHAGHARGKARNAGEARHAGEDHGAAVTHRPGMFSGIDMCMDMHLCQPTCISAFGHSYMLYIHIYIYMYYCIHIHTDTHVYIYIYTYIYIYIYTHLHMQMTTTCSNNMLIDM